MYGGGRSQPEIDVLERDNKIATPEHTEELFRVEITTVGGGKCRIAMQME